MPLAAVPVKDVHGSWVIGLRSFSNASECQLHTWLAPLSSLPLPVGGGLCLAGASPKREGSQDLGLVGSLVAVGGDSRVLSLCGQGLAPRILRTRDGAGPREPPTAPISALMEPPPFPAGDTPLIRGHWETLPMSATWEQVQREPHTWGLLPTLLPCKPLRAGHLLPWAPRAGPLPSDFGHIPGTSCSQ